MKKVLVIYHREDNDGVCSAGIVQSWLTRYPVINRMYDADEFEFYGVNYADLSADWEELLAWTRNPTDKKPRMAKWDKFETVFMVDISFNSVDAMNYMWMNFGQNFHWCDHHAPIIKASETEEFHEAPGLRRTDQSALLNTWYYLADHLAVMRQTGQRIEPSNYLRQLSDYDSWAWAKMDEYKEETAQESLFSFNTGVTRKSNLKVAWFSNWVGAWLDNSDQHRNIALDAFEYGQIVFQLDKERTARAISTHGDTGWRIGGNEQDTNPRKACALVTTDRFNSQSFAKFRGTDITNGIVFKIDAANDKVVMSLYNVNDDDTFDCGVFCKNHYMGGGHKGAAGATISRETFTQMFLNKYI